MPLGPLRTKWNNLRVEGVINAAVVTVLRRVVSAAVVTVLRRVVSAVIVEPVGD